VRYLIQHETALAFPKPVREHQCELRLVPREDEAQRVISADITISPDAFLGGYSDCFGNVVTTVSLVPAHDALSIALEAEIETLRVNPFDYAAVPAAEERAWIESELRREPRLWDFVLHRSESVPSVGTFGDLALPPPCSPQRSVMDAVQEAMAWAADAFRYDPDVANVQEPLSTFLEERAGACQDFAHLLVAVSRSWGIPARYAAGYLDPSSVEARHGEAEDPAVGVDQPPAAHAWAEVLVPGAGWRGFDATQRLVVNETYVTVAVGRDSRDAAPFRGSFKGDDPGDSPQVRISVSRAPQQ
jgi:transglutaminase-like putative cysteine protease